jgi:hypothetical protein
MAKALVNKIGCGTGKLYAVKAATGAIIMVDDNDFNGVKQMRQLGIIASPLAAARSAVGTITILQVDGGGDFSDITVNGVSIIGAPYTVTTTDEVFEANGLAAAINAYTPLSGPKYFAVSDGNIISLQAPEIDAEDYNNYVIAVTVSVISIETEVTDFDGGSNNNGVYDVDFGLQFYLDNNVSATNTINGTDAIDVTSIFAMRGLQTGIYTVEDADITDDTITLERKSAITSLILSPETGSSDQLVLINPSGFIAGDILILKTTEGNIVSVEQFGGSPKMPKNIILTNGISCSVTYSDVLMLQYQYTESVGGVFSELVRSFNSSTYTPTGTNPRLAVFDLSTHDFIDSQLSDLSFTPANAVTSGPLIVGRYYRIVSKLGSDDFSNVADIQYGTINTNNCIFKATGTTPTDWSANSILYRDYDFGYVALNGRGDNSALFFQVKSTDGAIGATTNAMVIAFSSMAGAYYVYDVFDPTYRKLMQRGGNYSLRNEDNLIIAEIYQGRHSFCPAPPGSGTSWDAIISSFADQDALNNSGKLNFLLRALGLSNVMGMLFVTNNQVGDLEVTVPSSIVIASTVVIMSGGITTGPLVVGSYYKIEAIDFSPLDDFSNVADVQSGVINTIGCIFIATGTTPTDWTHGTILLDTISETYSTLNSVTNKGTEVEFDFSTSVEIPEKYSFKFDTVTAFEIFSNKITAVLQTFADNAAALTGGLVANDVYKTASGELRIVV